MNKKRAMVKYDMETNMVEHKKLDQDAFASLTRVEKIFWVTWIFSPLDCKCVAHKVKPIESKHK